MLCIVPLLLRSFLLPRFPLHVEEHLRILLSLLVTTDFVLQVFKRGQLKFAKQKYLEALKLLDHALDTETDEQAGARIPPRPLPPLTPSPQTEPS
jgi:hypothetical protein